MAQKIFNQKIHPRTTNHTKNGVACVSVQKNELNWIIWFDWIVPFKLSKNRTIYTYQVIIRRLFSCPLLCTRGRSGSIFQTPSTINLICTTGKFVFVFMRMMRKLHRVINWLLTSYLPGYNFRYKEKIPQPELSILLCMIT